MGNDLSHTTGRAFAIWCSALFLACLSSNSHAFEVEMGPVTIQDTFVTPTWTSVTFIRPFSTRPVVAVLPTTNGGDPMTLRIRNVTTTGFEVVTTEPTANDGQHLQNDTAYLAIEPGNHVLPDGSRIMVIEHSTTSFATRLISTTWDSLSFPSVFPATPAIVAQIQTIASEDNTPPTTNSNPFMDVGIRNVTTTGLQVTLERAESAAGTVDTAERIGIIAIENNTDLSFVDSLGNNARLQGILTPDNIRGYDNGCYTNSYPSPFSSTPLVVASQNRRDGGDGGWLRRCSQASSNVGLTVDEDIDNDSERGHTTEAAGIIAGSTAFHANFDVDLLVTKNVQTQSDPLNGTTNQKAIPGADMEYTIGVSNRGSTSPDLDTLIITDDVPTDLRLCVTAACLSGGPVIFDDSGSPVSPGVTLGAIEYSNDGGTSFVYTPVPDADGFDDAVDAIRITMNGTMASFDPAGAPSFELRLLARVD